MSNSESKPFSSGTEYEWFKEIFCEKCKKHKVRDDGFPAFPEDGGCEIEDALEYARFDISKYPKEYIRELRDDCNNSKVIRWHYCNRYSAKDGNFEWYFDEMKRAIMKPKSVEEGGLID